MSGEEIRAKALEMALRTAYQSEQYHFIEARALKYYAFMRRDDHSVVPDSARGDGSQS